MSDTPTMPAALTLIEKRKNRAADAALAEALPDLDPAPQAEALRIIAQRGHPGTLATIAARFNNYEPAIQSMLLAQIGDLSGGIRVAVGSEEVEARCAAVEFLRRSKDPKLAYLLTGVLRGTCPKTRGLAAQALAELAERSTKKPRDHQAPTERIDYLAEALSDAIRCWESHLQPAVLRAAMLCAHRTEDAFLRKLAEPRTNIDVAIGSILSKRFDPQLAGFTMRALAMPRIRGHAARVIEQATDPKFLRAVGESQWLLADPYVRQGVGRVKKLNWTDDAIAILSQVGKQAALGLIRLIAASGINNHRKAEVLRAVLESEDQARQSGALWALVEDMSQEGAVALDRIATTSESPLSPIAARELQRRGISVPPQSKPSKSGGSDAWSQVWDGLDLDTSDRTSVSRDLRKRAADLLEPLKKKLDATIPMERIRALRIARWMRLAKQVDTQVYRLANDPDPMVRGTAIALLAHLPGPVSLRILRRAIEDPDNRVQANAVEALAILDEKECRRWVGPKLTSEHGRVKGNAVQALLRLEMREAGDALLEMLNDPARGHRISGLWVVERLRLKAVVQRVERLSREDSDPQVRRRAGRVLRGLFGGDPPEDWGTDEPESDLDDSQGGVER